MRDLRERYGQAPGDALLVVEPAAVEPLGFDGEKRPFTPHLTLARFRTPVRLEEVLTGIDVPSLAPFVVASFTLYRSFPTSSGSRYEPIERFTLG